MKHYRRSLRCERIVQDCKRKARELQSWREEKEARKEKENAAAKQANRKVSSIVNRALLERLSTYQPRPGLAASRPNAFHVLFWAGLVMVLAVVVPSCLEIVEMVPP